MRILSPIISGSLTVSGASILSGSLNVTQGITGSLLGTATNALTASYLSGYVSPFPFTGSAIISGSLQVTGSTSATSFIKSGGTSDQYLRADGSVSTALNSRIESNFIATANQTTFPLTYEVGQLEVYYNGSKLYPNEFTASNGTSFVLSQPATEGAQISAVKYVSTLTTAAVRTETTFTTTLNQTTFTVNYTPGQVDVFYNGAKLNISEFTATNGTSVVLGFACAADESVSIISYVSEVSGASGTSGYLSKFTGAASLGDSAILQSGSSIGINQDTPVSTLDVAGTFKNSIPSLTGGQTKISAIDGISDGYVIDVDVEDNISYTWNKGSNTPAMYIDPAGNVSIGSTSPVAKFSVIGAMYGGSMFFTNGVISPLTGTNFIINTNSSERLRVTTAGNVGIGTTNPTFRLEVSGSGRFTVGTGATIDMSSPGGATGMVYNTSATNNYSRFNTYNSPNATSTSRYFALEWDDTGAGLRIMKSGNVGIGTSTFVYNPKLAINSVGQNSLAIQTTDSVQGTTGSVLYIGNGATTGNTYGVIRALTTGGTGIGNLVLQPDGAGYVGINTTTPGYNLDVEGYMAVKSGGYGGGGYVIKNYASAASRGWGIFNDQYVFGDFCINQSTTQTGSPNITRVYINASGNVGIGTTSPGQPLDVAGNVRGTGLIINNATGNQQLSFQKNASMRFALGTEIGSGTTNDFGIYNYIAGATAMTIYGNNNYQFFGSNVSDRRAKQDIEDLDFNATEKVMALQPKSYYMKNDSDQIRYGLIAQDVHEILPDLVCGDLQGEGFIGLDYNGIIPVLVKAIQELKAEIEILKNK